jgi:hypothetical protein
MLRRHKGSFLLIRLHFSSECHRWSAVAECGSSAETALPGLEQKDSWRDTELERTSEKDENCEGGEQEIESYGQIYIRRWQEVVQTVAQSPYFDEIALMNLLRKLFPAQTCKVSVSINLWK